MHVFRFSYVGYFSGLLSGSTQINNHALFLHNVVVHAAPNFDGRGGCRPCFKIYQNMSPHFVSAV